jgi:hypothetical protein
MSTFYELLLMKHGDDTAKVKCIIEHLKLDTEFVERYNFISTMELEMMLSDAASRCSHSIFASPLILAVIVSIVILVTAVFAILIGRLVKK